MSPATAPFVLSIPHGASEIPPDILKDIALDREQILESVDHGSLEIFQTAPAAVRLMARWSRLTVDLNRDPERGGEKGVTALVDYHGRRIFLPGREPDQAETARRAALYHQPYHRELARALARDDILGLWDCHSLDGVGPTGAPDPGARRADVVLGSGGPRGRIGGGKEASCPAEVLEIMGRAFERQGLSTAHNDPYAGGYITRHYGGLLRPRGKWAVQIEVNKGLFLNSNLEIDPARLEAVRKRIARAMAEIASELTQTSS